eukprot:TRINITY_DN21248_c0_g1_i1.p1 TRINITY_DN21248_c0_g1~~TRINITY_DN21248_c0_g1_i1.p1  ORF type:complete len:137 (+),score=16.79 TRINITY_DN21248_c0_g1_i1:36-413(+)
MAKHKPQARTFSVVPSVFWHTFSYLKGLITIRSQKLLSFVANLWSTLYVLLRSAWAMCKLRLAVVFVFAGYILLHLVGVASLCLQGQFSPPDHYIQNDEMLEILRFVEHGKVPVVRNKKVPVVRK